MQTMTPAVDYKKALEDLDNIVEAYCMSLDMVPPVPDEGSQTAEQVARIKQALQPCAEAMTEDELVDILRLKWNSALGADRFRDKHDEFRQYIRALIQAGHLKVKA